MTVMPDHAVRLVETATLLVLDPMQGPVARPISAIALGDEVLVAADGRMCFRRVMAAHEAVAPDDIVKIPTHGLGIDMPNQALWLDARQSIGEPNMLAPLSTASGHGQGHIAPDAVYWLDVTAEGAERIIVDNLAVTTGALAHSIPEPGSDDRRDPEPVIRADAEPGSAPATNATAAPSPVRAFSGPTELASSGVVSGALAVYRFILPPRTTTLRLSSPSALPPGDGRKLGVAVLRLELENSDIPLDSPALVRGFHRAESGEGQTWRWTDGEALLLLPPKSIPQTLAVHITDWHLMLQTS